MSNAEKLPVNAVWVERTGTAGRRMFEGNNRTDGSPFSNCPPDVLEPSVCLVAHVPLLNGLRLAEGIMRTFTFDYLKKG